MAKRAKIPTDLNQRAKVTVDLATAEAEAEAEEEEEEEEEEAKKEKEPNDDIILPATPSTQGPPESSDVRR